MKFTFADIVAKLVEDANDKEIFEAVTELVSNLRDVKYLKKIKKHVDDECAYEDAPV